MVPAREPDTEILLDTPPGLVRATVHVEHDRPTAVTIRNVPSFLHLRDQAVDVPGYGQLVLDIAYGGNWFGILSQDQLKIPVEKANLRALLTAADQVRSALQGAGIVGFDPISGASQPVDHIEIYAHREVAEGVGARTLTLCPGMAYDRSPCGTGTSAKLAVLHARGRLAVGQRFFNQSIVGTEFVGTVLEETEVDGRPAVVPQVKGSAYITGFQQFVFDPDDPLVYGFR
jgi:proline racemase